MHIEEIDVNKKMGEADERFHYFDMYDLNKVVQHDHKEGDTMDVAINDEEIEKQIDDILKEVDLDGDGMINYSEYIKRLDYNPTMICGKIFQSATNALPQRLVKIVSVRSMNLLPNKSFVSHLNTHAAMGPHALLFKIERYLAAGMVPLLPAAYFIHGTTMDLLLSAAIVMHSHWGMMAVVQDYARPIVVGERLARISPALVYVVSTILLVGLFHYNLFDIGLTKSFEKEERRRAEALKAFPEGIPYTDLNNPFNDTSLSETFIWKKKWETEGKSSVSKKKVEKINRETIAKNFAEMEQLKKNREARDAAKEDVEMINRDQERRLCDWNRTEDAFHMNQARLRSSIRIKEGRAKPIDLLARYISYFDESTEEDYHLDNPLSYIPKNSIDDLEDLIADIGVYRLIDGRKNADFWDDIESITKSMLKKLVENKRRSSDSGTVHSSVQEEIFKIFKGKSYTDLQHLENQIVAKIKNASKGTDVSYWEALLNQLGPYMAKQRLGENYAHIQKVWLKKIRNEQMNELKEETSEGLSTLVDQKSKELLCSSKDSEAVWKSANSIEELRKEVEETRFVMPFSFDDFQKFEDEVKEQHFQQLDTKGHMRQFVLKCYEYGRYSPTYGSETHIMPGIEILDESNDAKKLQEVRKNKRNERKDADLSASDKRMMDIAKMGMTEDEAVFAVEEALEQQHFLWSDKYRPRKPRYFNRVHTGFDWNKYNQTHYDIDNPPQKLFRDIDLIYPAAHLYIYRFFYSLTDEGKNIKRAQYIFASLYLFNLLLVFRLYFKSKRIPPFVLCLICLSSYRIHSIYVLRLFNDPIAIFLFYLSINLFISRQWLFGCIIYSFAVGVKMNILLFAPALFFVLLLSNGFFDTYCLLFFFVDLFSEQGGLINLLKRLWFGIRTRLDTHDILFVLFSSNLIGIIFARSLHYQFYCWYYHSIPYLLFSPIYRLDYILYKGDNNYYNNNIIIPFKSVLFRDEFGYRLADKVFDLLKSNTVCIDVGCGTGHIGMHLISENVGCLIQFDMSDKMVKISKSAEEKEFPTLRFIADEELIPLRPECADLILSGLSVHWINDLPKWFLRCFKTLKEDGVIIGGLLAGETLHELRVSLQLAEMERLGGIGAHISPFVEAQDIAALMNKCGFTLVTIDVDEIVINYPDMFALIPSIPVEREDYKGNSILNDSVDKVDQEIYSLVKKEKERQKLGIHLIASENFTSRSVSEIVGSCLTNKYSEGYPGVRYYGGNEYIDQIEIICQNRALKLFGLDPEKWGVNVQALSGSPANFAVYTAILEPHGRLMGLELTDGGHLTHGFFSPTKKVSATSLFFESMPYKVNPTTGLIDYDLLEQNSLLFRPKLIIAGTSCYAQLLDYKRFRSIADKCGSYLMADMAHIAGLVASGVIPSPFEYSDIVTTTTHKTLRGPRGALIFFRKGIKSINSKGEKTFYDFESKINSAVFPGLQGGPHNHSIAAIAVALKQCLTNEFVEYSHQILKNSKALANSLKQLGYTLVTGGTQTHLCLLDLRPKNLDAARIEHLLNLVHIVTNKNTCPGDKSALRPGGVRLGTPAMTSRGLKENDFEKIAEFIDKAIKIYQKNEEIFVKVKTLKEFKQIIENNNEFKTELDILGKEIIEFSKNFILPGKDDI
ncbi:hypothetical protein Mgra_00003255 [Meloidogyne graminicola]|uniref:Serine hydroxymethyltransferase n=1 Tax=Meloidogyne graminicola TaxID=189291 RepID=A0A8S9ZUM6_9BILA|nr:hypothetical protein Mgra_00003255 [Meloidogyne graminicola]